MSVEDILKSIKGIITNHNKPEKEDNITKDEEVLELTNIIKEGKKTDNSVCKDELSNDEDEYLVSEKSALEASGLLKNFANTATRAAVEGKKIKNSSLEDLVTEMMKPMLGKWLNENLPAIVRNVVEKEIKRLAPDE